MKHKTSSLQLCGQPTVLTLTQSTTRFGGKLQDRVYRSQIRDVYQVKSRLIEEWEHFQQVVIDKAVRMCGIHVFELAFDFEHTVDILNTDFRCAEVRSLAIRADAHLTVIHACAYSGHLCF